MRRLIYHVASSIDGQIADGEGSFAAFMAVEGEHAGDYLESLRSYGAVLMGRATYEVGLRAGITDPYPYLEGYVFSRTMKEDPDPNVRLVSENATDAVRELKQREGKPIYLCGGGALAAVLLDAGLIDELIVKLNPLILGPGIPMFGRVQRPVFLRLKGNRTYPNGVVLLTYEVASPGGFEPPLSP